VEKYKIQIAVPANLQYSSLVRHIADEIFGMAKFEKSWCSRLKLVVDELFMNAVRYGSTEDKSLVYITIQYNENEMLFTIEDDGSGPQAISAEELIGIIEKNKADQNLTRTSGRGLSMITKVWTDDMIITKSEHGGIAITIKKKIETIMPSPPVPTGLIEQAGIIAEALEEPQIKPAKGREAVMGGPVYEIKLQGEIDKSNIDEKVAPIHDQVNVIPPGSVLVLDFSDVIYINSIFIGNLASWYTAMNKKGGSVRLKNMNNQIKEVLDLVGLLNVLELTS